MAERFGSPYQVQDTHRPRSSFAPLLPRLDEFHTQNRHQHYALAHRSTLLTAEGDESVPGITSPENRPRAVHGGMPRDIDTFEHRTHSHRPIKGTDPMTEPLTTETIGATGHTGVKVRLVYDPADPHAIVVSFWDWYGRQWLNWMWDRTLLAQALKCETNGTVTGGLDALVTRVNDRTTKLTKVTRDAWWELAEVVLCTAKLASFLEETFTLVPAGQERIDLDVEALLRRPSGKTQS